MEIVNGLPYIPIRPPTNTELETLPHEIMTSPDDWDPASLDDTIDSDNNAYSSPSDAPLVTIHKHIDEYGDYRLVYHNERHL
jgi:hypothetical protein